MSKKIRCVKIEGGAVKYLIPRLANDTKFLKQNGLRRADIPEVPSAPSTPNMEGVDIKVEGSVDPNPPTGADTPTQPQEQSVGLSKDIDDWREAVAAVKAIKSESEVQAFVIGEHRKSVLKAANEVMGNVE